jgi:diguanylate cyclase (GGDEF)-like protein
VLEELASCLSERAAGATDLAIAMIDLDQFKPINDEHGHVVGDRVLRAFCDRVQRVLRRTDVFGRYGGDEFLVVLPETSQREALEIARRTCEALSRHPIECGDISLRVSASIGVASADDAMHDREELIKRADRALFRAKNAGGNCAMCEDGDGA